MSDIESAKEVGSHDVARWDGAMSSMEQYEEQHDAVFSILT